MKEKKLKKKNIIIATIILLIILIEIINPIKLYNQYQLKNIGFSDVAIENILKNNLKKEILENGYTETLDEIFKSKDYDLKNFNRYTKIKYHKLDNYTKIINQLIKKGYSDTDINNILKNATNEEIKDFLDEEYKKDISKFLQYDFSILNNLNRYIAYQNEHNMDAELVVIHVNIGLDKKYYEDVTTTDKFSYDMLVNKYHGVTESFVPEKLVDVPETYGTNQKLNEETLKAFIKMSNDCKAETGYQLLVRSGYRDFKEQEKTYNLYLKSYGKTYAENYVTHPGYSEHHTGLAIDIKAESNNIFSDSKESKWAYKNAYKYGFILRYKKEYENITGIKYESWHFRYVGEEIATYINDNDMTYEEYYVRFLNNE